MKHLILTFLFSTLLWANAHIEITLNDGRTIIADTEGLTLYTFDIDEEDLSNCAGQCLVIWPPALIDDDSQLEAPFGSFLNHQGELQLTYNRQPLYRFFGDKLPGEIRGDGLQGVWHIIVKPAAGSEGEVQDEL